MPWTGPGENHYTRLWTTLLVIVLVFAGLLAWPRAKRVYVRWSAKRQVAHAEQMLASGDYKRAIIDARNAIDADSLDIKATRILARSLHALESPAAGSWWSRLDSLQPGDPETLIPWAVHMVKANDFTAAERILQGVKAADQDSADYHYAAARVATWKRDLAAAEEHWAEACKLRPDDDGYRLALASLRLDSRNADERKAAEETLTGLAAKKPKGIEAQRVLLGDATRRKDWERAATLADGLVADAGATFGDKLHRLEVLRAMKSNRATECLLELKAASLSNRNEFYLLLMWMNQNDLALMVSEWARTLPPETIDLPPVAVAVAEAYAKGSEWKRLQEFVTKGTWNEWDYMRRGFLARALERTGEIEAASQEWKEAVAAAINTADSTKQLERLTRAAISWDWPQRAEEVMWGIAGKLDCPRWVLEGLWNLCLYRTETPQLQKLSSILRRSDSKSVEFQNNFAFYTLLTRTDEGDPHTDAEKLSTENPGNPAIAITRGLSLYQQGKVAEAAATLKRLKPESLRMPQVALYYTIFVTAAGDPTKAAEYLPLAKEWKMFPEEKALLDRVRVASSKAVTEAARPAGVPR